MLFRASGSSAKALSSRLERTLSATFDYPGTVTLRSHRQLGSIIDGAPADFGTDPDRYRYDVIFLLPPLSAGAAMDGVGPKEGVDQAHAGHGVLCFTRLIERASQSRLTRLASMPAHQFMAVRNWRTTTRLLELMDAPR